MSSKVQICNLALIRLGVGTITSLSDNTDAANLCNILYDDIRDEVLSEGPWSVTVTRKELNKTTNTPSFGYTYEFQLPTSPKCLKVLEINEEVPGTYDYRIEGDKLLANISTMRIKYIGQITDTGLYSPWLKRALVSRLAAELAYNLTGSSRVAELMMAKYERDLATGLSNDTQQGSADDMPSSDLIEVR